ncbi:hypothetical protein [Arthrobacter sp. NPDC056493]|uniref:hypothetical protein n=1 Tax=Arthrobacter sp. NPDC056493 TaxID=3345839 RepID=UPI00366DF313
MRDYTTKLTELQRSHQAAVAKANEYTNPDLSAEGIDKRRAELIAKAGEDHKAKLDHLAREFKDEATETKRVAAAAIPTPAGDTSQAWGRAKMLLEAGQTLQQIVAKADPALLHAVTEWGPTYLEAEAYKGRSDGFAPVAVDAAPLQRSIRQRWTQVLDGFAPGRIERGAEAEAVEAEFQVTAQHFAARLDGIHVGADDLTAAIEARLAGQRAGAGLAKEGDAA